MLTTRALIMNKQTSKQINKLVLNINKMENHENSNQSTDGTNNTSVIYGDNASPLFTSFSIMLSSWIVIVNVFIFLCLIKNQRLLIKNTFAFQMFILSICDLLVGLSTLPVYVIAFTSEISYELCLCNLGFMLTAQAVEQFHIFGICVNRASITCQLSTPMRISENKRGVVIYLLVNWVVFLLIFFVPFKIWGKYRPAVAICSLNEVVQDNYKVYATYTLSFYLLPSILINAVYFAILIKLACSSCLSLNSPMSNENNSIQQQSSNCDVSSNREKTEQKSPSIEQAHSQANDASDGSITGLNQDQFEIIMTINGFKENINGSIHVEQKFTNLKEENTVKDHQSVVMPLEKVVSHHHRSATDIISQPTRNEQTSVSRYEYDRRPHDPSTKPTFTSQRRALTAIGMIMCNISVILVSFKHKTNCSSISNIYFILPII